MGLSWLLARRLLPAVLPLPGPERSSGGGLTQRGEPPAPRERRMDWPRPGDLLQSLLSFGGHPEVPGASSPECSPWPKNCKWEHNRRNRFKEHCGGGSEEQQPSLPLPRPHFLLVSTPLPPGTEIKRFCPGEESKLPTGTPLPSGRC